MLHILFFFIGLFQTITSNPLNILEFLIEKISNFVLSILKIIFDDHSSIYDSCLEFRYEHPVFAFLIMMFILYQCATLLDHYVEEKNKNK